MFVVAITPVALHQLVGTPHQRVTPLDERLRVLLKNCTPRTLVEIRRLSD